MQWFLGFGLAFLLLSSACVAAPASPTSTTAAPQSTACGDIVNSQDQYIFNASLAYECLTSVPFNPAVATRFLEYYNDTLQFLSTSAYLKNPPTSYQQPAVDVFGGLAQLQQGINNGLFPNQYEFEAALQTLLYATHDAHVNLIAGVLAAFSFASPRDIVSVSLDGIQLPKVYLADDLFDSSYFTTFQPSAIKLINGVDAITYLAEFASKNSIGTLEPHTDWNQLMLSPGLDIQGLFDVFSGGATFYPGDTIKFQLENGTQISDFYQAIYNSPGPTGPLETGGDFYNFFVLGFYPASFDPNSDDSGDSSTTSSSSTPTSTLASTTTSSAVSSATSALSWDNIGYPTIPDVAQPDLGLFGGGYVSGYFLNSTSISVLSIPSFDVFDDDVNTFQDTVAQFISRTQAAGLKKIVIDLQQNTGGQTLLAFDTFKHFFPNIDPFAGSRMRAQPFADLMGDAITGYWNSLNNSDDDYYVLAANEWVATSRINANTGQNFTSWAEFFGPNSYYGDNFTTTQRYNLSSYIFDESVVKDFNDDYAVYGYDANPAPPNSAPPYAAENIIILSDGMCSSTCSLFMEMMHYEAGVRVVVAGGKPITGPMQSPSGSRGARLYSVSTLDANIDYAKEILTVQNSTDAGLLPNRTEALDVYITHASINLRDQVRRGETTPLQFAYEAADCRIFFTPRTVYNYTALWQYAADAIWTTPSHCVANSTGYAITGTNKTDFIGPPSSVIGTSANLTHLTPANISSLSSLLYLNDGLPDGGFTPRNSITSKPCQTSKNCGAGFACASVTICLGSGKTGPSLQCVPSCFVALAPCSNGGRCQLQQPVKGAQVGSQNLYQGICPPPVQVGKCNSVKVNVGPPPPI